MSGPRVLLVSCYELGHAPLGIAWPLAFLKRAGFTDVATLDLAVEPFDPARTSGVDVAIVSVPGDDAFERLRAVGVAASRRAGGTRVGFHLYNTEADAMAAADALHRPR